MTMNVTAATAATSKGDVRLTARNRNGGRQRESDDERDGRSDDDEPTSSLMKRSSLLHSNNPPCEWGKLENSYRLRSLWSNRGSLLLQVLQPLWMPHQLSAGC
ncbi:hypothetical protein C5Y93_07905 [Blastopirellula marina]|uniref:Uncharacterized protein n=1 Tax=Blastopirellula marina TaxID=124 RepID=A0A2S8GQN9_9BACT|nr:hypothetical protein C5Y93_07905 [Blastopirellula marina]